MFSSFLIRNGTRKHSKLAHHQDFCSCLSASPHAIGLVASSHTKKQWKWLLSWLLQELKVQTPEIHLRNFFVSIIFDSGLTLFWKRENSQNQPSSWEAGIKSGRPLFAAIIAPFSHTRPLFNDAAIWHRQVLVLYRSISSCVVCIEASKQYGCFQK